MIPRKLCLIYCALGMLVGGYAAAQSDELNEIRSLTEQGQIAGAMSRIDSYLAKNPDSPQGRFLKGILLVEQDQAPQAIELFTKLTKDYPDLPEPHNNLAVLYASNGEYTKARDALLVAINTHPSYATAHENLGDIYAKMAGIAYDNALQLDRDNSAAKAKLDLMRDLLSIRANGSSQGTVTGSDTRNMEVAATQPLSQGQVRQAQSSAARAELPLATVVPVESTVAAAQPVQSSISSSQSTGQSPGPVPASVAMGVEEDEAMSALEVWAASWSGQDTEAYLSFYAPEFAPARGVGRRQWERQRRERIERPQFIDVSIVSPVVELRGPGAAQIDFTQRYRSDSYGDEVRKQVRLQKISGQWKIVREITLQ